MNVLARARWTNGVLALLALLALGFVLFTRRLPTRAELALREHNVLGVFDEAEVSRIVVERGPERVVLVRAEPRSGTAGPDSDGTEVAPAWRLLEPIEADADAPAVDKLLGTLHYATWVRQLDAAGSAKLEVAPGQLAIELVQGERSYRLRLGGASPAPAGSRYLELVERGPGAASAPRWFVIKQSLVEELDRSPAVFRGRQLAPYSRRSVKQLVLEGAGGERRLERAGSDFRFRGMLQDVRAERAALERVFFALTQNPTVSLPLEQAQAALAQDVPGAVEVVLVPSAPDEPEARLAFGGTCPNNERQVVALRRAPEPLAGCVDSGVLAALSQPAPAMVDRGLFSLNLDELERLESSEGERALALARKGAGFTLLAPREAELDAQAVNDRLSRLLALRGELVSPAPPALNEAEVEIELSVEAAAASAEGVRETVRVSAAARDGSVRVYRDADGATLSFSREQRAALALDTSLLKPLAVFDYAAHQVKRIDVAAGALAQSFTRDANGDLALVSPAGFVIDASLALDLTDRLRGLTALRWVTDRQSTGFGLEEPRATAQLVLEVDGKELTRSLRLGQRTEGGFYAAVDRDPGVFVAPSALERSLSTWLLDRSLFSVRRAQLERVTLESAQHGRLRAERAGGELAWAGDARGRDPAGLEELLDALESLRPEAAVHLGAPRAGEGLERPLLTCRIERTATAGTGQDVVSFSVGSRDSFRDASIYYARSSAADAVYALPRAQVQRLFDVF
jgi:uncharacterized protein DUF4340